MAGISQKAAAPESILGLDAGQLQEFIPEEEADRTLRLLAEDETAEERAIEGQRFSGDPERQILALYREYRPQLFRYLYSLKLEADRVDEVVQEAFMRLTIELAKRGSMENVQGWLVRVAHNLAMDVLNEKERSTAGSSPSEFVLRNCTDPGLSPEEAYLANERVVLMEAALSSFGKLSRECFAMRVQGFRYKDIAMALGVSEQRAAFVVKQAAMRLAAICG